MYSESEEESDATEFSAPLDAEKPMTTESRREEEEDALEATVPVDERNSEVAIQVRSQDTSPVCDEALGAPELSTPMDKEESELEPASPVRKDIYTPKALALVDEENSEARSPALEENIDILEPSVYVEEEKHENASPPCEKYTDAPEPLAPMYKDEEESEPASPVREEDFDFLKPLSLMHKKETEVTSLVRESAETLEPSIYAHEEFEASSPIREENVDILKPSIYANEERFEASSPVREGTSDALELSVPMHEELNSSNPVREGTIDAMERTKYMDEEKPEVTSSMPAMNDTALRSPSVFSDAERPESPSLVLEDKSDAPVSSLHAKEAEAISPILEVQTPRGKDSDVYEMSLKSPSMSDTPRPLSVCSASKEKGHVPEFPLLGTEEAEAKSLIPKVQAPDIEEPAQKAPSISSDTQRPESLYSASEDSHVSVSPVLEAVHVEPKNPISEVQMPEVKVPGVYETAPKAPSISSNTQRPESMYSTSEGCHASVSPVLEAVHIEAENPIPEVQTPEIEIAGLNKTALKSPSTFSDPHSPESMHYSSEDSDISESPVLETEEVGATSAIPEVQVSEVKITKVDETAPRPLSISSDTRRPESIYSEPEESDVPESPVLGAEKDEVTSSIPGMKITGINDRAPEPIYSESESDVPESPVLGAGNIEVTNSIPGVKITEMNDKVPEPIYSESEESDIPGSPVLGAGEVEVTSFIPEVKITEMNDKVLESTPFLPDVPTSTHSVSDKDHHGIEPPALDTDESQPTSSAPEVMILEVNGAVPESLSFPVDAQEPSSAHPVLEENNNKAVASSAPDAEEVKATSSIPGVTIPEVNHTTPQSSPTFPDAKRPAPAHSFTEENVFNTVDSSTLEAEEVGSTRSVPETIIPAMNHTTSETPPVFSHAQRPASAHSALDANSNDAKDSPSPDVEEPKAWCSTSDVNEAAPKSPAASSDTRGSASTHSIPDENNAEAEEPKALFFSTSEVNEAVPKSPASTHSVPNENSDDAEEPKALFSASELNEAAPKSPASSLGARDPGAIVSPIGSPVGVSSGWPLPDTQIKPNVEPHPSPSQQDSPVTSKPTEFKRSMHRLIERETVQKPDDVSSNPPTASAQAASHRSSPSWENASAYFKSLRSSFSTKPPLPPKTAPLPSTPMPNQTRSSPIHFSSPTPSPLRGSFRENPSHAPPTQQRTASSFFSTIGSRSSSPRDKALPSPPVPPKGSRASVDRFSSKSSTSLVPQADESWEAISGFFKTFPKSSDRVNIDTQLMLEDRSDNTKIRTLKRQLWEITGDGKKQDLPVNQEYILYEGSMYLCVHLFEIDGTVRSEVHLWCGDDVPDAAVDDAQSFSRRVARDNGSKLEIIKQGKEPARFIQALGGILITRRGSSSRSSSSAIFMLCGRKHLGQMVFDEVNFSPSSLCSGYPFVISAMFGKLFLWKGKGSSAEEIGAARLIGMDLGLTGEFEEVAEGEEPESFFEDFPQYERKTSNASTNYWPLKPNHGRYRSRLFRIDHELGQRSGFWMRSPSPVIRPNDTVQEVEPFCQKDITPKGIFVLDTFFEIYVIVGEQASNRPAEFATAVVLAHEYGILAASLQDRPFIPKSFVSIGGIPEPCSSAFRKWSPPSPSQRPPQVFPLNAAIEAIRSA